MIARITGRVVGLAEDRLLIEAGPLVYEVLAPPLVLSCLEDGDEVCLETIHYLQIDQSRATPVLVGFADREQRDFYEVLVGVLGPRVAVKALAATPDRVATWIEAGDVAALKSLPGVGQAKARELVAKLQGRLARFAAGRPSPPRSKPSADQPFLAERGPVGDAIEALVALGHTRLEAAEAVSRAVHDAPELNTVADIVRAAYRRR